MPAFTETEFQEAIQIQRKDDFKKNKLHVSISGEKIIRKNVSNLVLGVGESQERADVEEDEEHESDNDRELFSGLLGNGDEDAIQIKARKREEKKKLVAQVTASNSLIRPFVWNPSLIKDDPLKAMKLEEKKEKIMPGNLQPEEPTMKLKAKLKDSLRKKDGRNNRQAQKSVPVQPNATLNENTSGFKLTTTRLTRPMETVK